MLARPLDKLWQRSFSELPGPTLWNKLRRFTKLADVPPVDLNHIQITVQLYEAINPARKFHSRRDWTSFHFVPAIVGRSQTASRHGGRAGQIGQLRTVNRLATVARKDILQGANLCFDYSERHLTVVSASGVQIDPKQLKQLVQLVPNEVDVTACQRLLSCKQDDRGI